MLSDQLCCRDVSLLLDQSWGVKDPSDDEAGPSSSTGDDNDVVVL